MILFQTQIKMILKTRKLHDYSYCDKNGKERENKEKNLRLII